MYNNILTYVCFFILCGLLVLDMWFCSSVALQIVCLILVCVVLILVVYVAHKYHKGTYLSNEQAKSYQAYLSENIALQKELNHIKSKQATTKQNGSELQTLVLINSRLTAQISNLKTHLLTVTEQLQTAKNQGTTVVVALPTNEQKQTASNNKKAKTA